MPQDSSASCTHLIHKLLDTLNNQSELRVSSLVVTVFGDAILPRGGSVWLSTLQELFDALQIEASALRAAMSRLTSDGLLERERVGRRSVYRLSETLAQESHKVSRIVYARQITASGEWLIALPSEAETSNPLQHHLLKSYHFGRMSGVYFRPKIDELPVPIETLVHSGITVFDSAAQHFGLGQEPQSFTDQLWRTGDLAEAYHRFLATFGNLFDQPDWRRCAPMTALATRTLLIHAFRRLVLRDPLLPPHALPSAWPGEQARAQTATLYRHVLTPSEMWLTRHQGGAPGDLKPAEQRLHARFT